MRRKSPVARRTREGNQKERISLFPPPVVIRAIRRDGRKRKLPIMDI
jgi:hypothetical protein